MDRDNEENDCLAEPKKSAKTRLLASDEKEVDSNEPHEENDEDEKDD